MQPPPPPIPSTPAPSNCQWCSQPINSTDTRCSHCGKLRKEIYTDKVKCYLFCLIGGALIGISIGMMNEGRQNEFEYYAGNTSSGGNSTQYIILALGILAALAGIYFYVKVSQRLKAWWWV